MLPGGTLDKLVIANMTAWLPPDSGETKSWLDTWVWLHVIAGTGEGDGDGDIVASLRWLCDL